MKTIKRRELIKTVALCEGVSEVKTRKVIDKFLALIQYSVAKGDKVALKPFASFEGVKTPARTGRNPKTGEPAPIPEKMRVKFRPGVALRDGINEANAKKEAER